MRNAMCIILLLSAATASAAAQTLLTDQIELLQPGLTKSVFWLAASGMGSAPCGGDLPAGGSALCEPRWTLDPTIGNDEQRNARWGAGVDAMRNVYHLMRRFVPGGADSTHVYEIVRLESTAQQAIVRLKNFVFTCFASGTPCLPQCGGADVKQVTNVLGMRIDAANGNIDLYMHSKLGCQSDNDLGEEWGIVRISGLPTLLDIILSYQFPSMLSFNVPVRPEGLPGADSFAVYAGDVRTAADLSQAAPLQCTVPVGRAPVPGEQLTVPDTLPDPSPGDGRYYVAAVRHGAQIRAGRSAINGVLQGRNSSALPGCQ